MKEKSFLNWVGPVIILGGIILIFLEKLNSNLFLYFVFIFVLFIIYVVFILIKNLMKNNKKS